MPVSLHSLSFLYFSSQILLLLLIYLLVFVDSASSTGASAPRGWALVQIHPLIYVSSTEKSAWLLLITWPETE